MTDIAGGRLTRSAGSLRRRPARQRAELGQMRVGVGIARGRSRIVLRYVAGVGSSVGEASGGRRSVIESCIVDLFFRLAALSETATLCPRRLKRHSRPQHIALAARSRLVMAGPRSPQWPPDWRIISASHATTAIARRSKPEVASRPRCARSTYRSSADLARRGRQSLSGRLLVSTGKFSRILVRTDPELAVSDPHRCRCNDGVQRRRSTGRSAQ